MAAPQSAGADPAERRRETAGTADGSRREGRGATLFSRVRGALQRTAPALNSSEHMNGQEADVPGASDTGAADGAGPSTDAVYEPKRASETESNDHAPDGGSDGDAGGRGSGAGRSSRPPVPDSLQCPICLDVMAEPVLVATGHTYDRACLERWFDEGDFTCPSTRQSLGRHRSEVMVVPNLAVRALVREWAAEHGVELPAPSAAMQGRLGRVDSSAIRAPAGSAVASAQERRGARQHQMRTQTQRIGHGQEHTPPQRGTRGAVDGVGTDVDEWYDRPPNTLPNTHMDEVWALLCYQGRLFSGSKDTNVHVWDGSTLELLGVMRGHSGSVLALAGVNGRVFSGAYDGTVRVWNADTLQHLKTLEGHTDAVRGLAVCGTRVFSASYDTTVCCWHADTLVCEGVMSDHTDAVRDLAVCPERGLVFSASYDSTVRAWDAGTFELKKTLLGHTAMVRALEFAGGRLFSGSDDFTVRAWDVDSLEPLGEMTGHTDMVRVLASRGEQLFSGSWDFSVRVWDTRSLSCLAVLQGHCDMVLALVGCPGLLFSGSYDACVRVWDTRDWRCVRVLHGHEDAVRVLALSDRDDRLFSGSYDAAVLSWDV